MRDDTITQEQARSMFREYLAQDCEGSPITPESLTDAELAQEWSAWLQQTQVENGFIDAVTAATWTPLPPEITIHNIIHAADMGYSSPGLVGVAFCGVDPGDSLASFIASELKDTFDQGDAGDNAYFIAADYIQTAIRDLESVRDELRRRARVYAEEEENA